MGHRGDLATNACEAQCPALLGVRDESQRLASYARMIIAEAGANYATPWHYAVDATPGLDANFTFVVYDSLLGRDMSDRNTRAQKLADTLSTMQSILRAGFFEESRARAKIVAQNLAIERRKLLLGWSERTAACKLGPVICLAAASPRIATAENNPDVRQIVICGHDFEQQSEAFDPQSSADLEVLKTADRSTDKIWGEAFRRLSPGLHSKMPGIMAALEDHALDDDPGTA